MNKKESSFMGLVGFEFPLRGEKKLLLKKENLDSVLKSVSTWSPASVVNLKMWILEIKVPQAKFFEIFKSSISKWVNGLNEPDSPNEIYPPPWNQKYFDPPPPPPKKRPQNSKVPNPPNLSGGCTPRIKK